MLSNFYDANDFATSYSFQHSGKHPFHVLQVKQAKGFLRTFLRITSTPDQRVKFLKTFEYGALRGEGYGGESALLCSQFGTQFLGTY